MAVSSWHENQTTQYPLSLIRILKTALFTKKLASEKSIVS